MTAQKVQEWLLLVGLSEKLLLLVVADENKDQTHLPQSLIQLLHLDCQRDDCQTVQQKEKAEKGLVKMLQEEEEDIQRAVEDEKDKPQMDDVMVVA